jgi:broad specificity phosphatase PhoE
VTRSGLKITGDVIPDGLDATIVLLRHGESEFIVEGRFQGQAETPLSGTGRRQARLAAARLARPHRAPSLPVPHGAPREIAHSPLLRTAETADAVAAASAEAGVPVPTRPDPGFAEIGQGEWEGRLHSEISERWGDVLSGWRRRPREVWAPGGESLDDVQARVRPALTRLLEPLALGREPGSLDRPQVAGYANVAPPDHGWSVVVGHDGVFKVLLLTLFDLPLERFWMFTTALCGITVVELRGGRPVLTLHNSTEHLAPLLDEQAEAVAEARARSGAL